MTKSKPRITKRKRPRYSGQMRLPESYAVRVNGEEKAIIQQMGGDFMSSYRGWFWYGMEHNTQLRSQMNKRTFDTANDALADFEEFYNAL